MKDLEREAIEQYQPEEDSVLTSGELFSPSELMKQSPVATPPTTNSFTQVNTFDSTLGIEKDKNYQNCHILRKTSSEYLLCSESWLDSIDNLLAESNILKFENSKISQSENSMTKNKKYLKIIQNETEIKVETPIHILKPFRSEELTQDVNTIYESSIKNQTLTSPYESPNEDQPVEEECSSKIVKLFLKRNKLQLTENNTRISSSNKEHDHIALKSMFISYKLLVNNIN